MKRIDPVAIACILAVAITGCVLPSDDAPTPQTPVYEFGDHYTLIQSDSMPHLQGDSLYVDLGYDCARAAFTLEYFKTADSAYEVWLNMPSQIRPHCAVPIIERHAFRIPDEVRSAKSVQLVTRALERIELIPSPIEDTIPEDTSSIDPENIRIVSGELLVELNEGYTTADLDSLLADLEAERRGGFVSEIIIVVVPESQEKHWAALLEQEEIVRTAQPNRFGYRYFFTEQNGFPYLAGDSLFVRVGYSGCGPGVDFTLEHNRTGSSSYEIWVFKESETICAAAWTEVRAFKLPDELQDAQSVQVVAPVNKRIELKPQD